MSDDLAAGRLVHVLPEWSYKPSPVHLVYAQAPHPTSKLRSVIDFMLRELAPRTRARS